MPSKKLKVKCITCKKRIQGKPRIMRLQITHEDDRMTKAQRKLGSHQRIGT